MLTIRVLAFILLILVIFSLYADAQQLQRQQQQQRQQQLNRRKKVAQKQQQLQQQQGQLNKPQGNKKIKNPNKTNNKIKTEKPEQKVKVFITHEIPGLGSVKGRTIKSEWSGKHILQFFDIPYGQAPIGSMRFKPSTPVAPWTNTLRADKPHYGCPSLQDFLNYETLKEKNVEVEDCLRLTINTKSVSFNFGEIFSKLM